MYGGTDHYAVLGLNPSAEDVVVHAAWKALLRKHHPDTNPGDPSGARAREINEAFAVLGKPDARARYDRLRTRGPDIVPLRHPPAPHEGPRYRPPPRRRLSANRLFGTALLIVAAVPFVITALLALPATGPATHDALLSLSAGSPFAEGLVSRLEAVAGGFTADPISPGAASIDSITNEDDGQATASN
jgi:curved DNA-binding protein CbpA